MAVVVVEGYISCRLGNYKAHMRILNVISMTSHGEGRLCSASPATPESGKLTIFRTQILQKMCSGRRQWKLRNAEFKVHNAELGAYWL